MHIVELLNNDNTSTASRKRLKICQHDYHKAVSALEEAFNDLNSESFFQVAKFAGLAATVADDCQSAF